ALNAIRVSTWMTSPLLGQIAANWIFDGTAERLAAQQRVIAKRRQEIAREVLDDFDVVTHQAALHVLLKLPEPWRSGQFTSQLQQRGVASLPSTEMSAE